MVGRRDAFRSILAVCVCVVAATGLAAQPANPRPAGQPPRKEPPRWQPKEGQKLYQEVLVAQKTTYGIQGLENNTHLQYGVLSEFTVLAVDQDGNITLEQKVLDARLHKADELTEGLIRDPLQKLAGTGFKLKIDPQGEVLSFEALKEPPKAAVMGDPLLGQKFVMASLLDRDAWKELAQLSFFQPGRALQGGEKWERSLTHSWGSLGEWQGSVTFTNTGKKGKYHQIRYAHKLAYAPAKGKTSELPIQLDMANFKHQEAGGVIYYSMEQGRVSGVEERFHVRGALGLNLLGQKVPLELDEDQMFRVTLLDQNPWKK